MVKHITVKVILYICFLAVVGGCSRDESGEEAILSAQAKCWKHYRTDNVDLAEGALIEYLTFLEACIPQGDIQAILSQETTTAISRLVVLYRVTENVEGFNKMMEKYSAQTDDIRREVRPEWNAYVADTHGAQIVQWRIGKEAVLLPCNIEHQDNEYASLVAGVRKIERDSLESLQPIGFVWIEPGSATIGSPKDEPFRHAEEEQVSITMRDGYWMSRYEVTQSQFCSVMGFNPSMDSEGKLPVTCLTWYDAVRYCRRLTDRERKESGLPDQYEFRLPTELEWEYACRAGVSAATAFGESITMDDANIGSDYSQTHLGLDPKWGRILPVGSFRPNGFGLHDMHGNVSEWVLDDFRSSLSDVGVSDSRRNSEVKIHRGGSWNKGGYEARSAHRSKRKGLLWGHAIGFRPVLAKVLTTVDSK